MLTGAAAWHKEGAVFSSNWLLQRKEHKAHDPPDQGVNMLKPSAVCVTLALAAVGQLGGVAQGAPLPNPVLSCPDENAIGHAFESCDGYIYELPTNESIVVSSSYEWRKAAPET